MNFPKKPLEIHTTPHIKSPVSLEIIMRNVCYALIPVILFSIYCFGVSIVLLLMVTSLSCLLTEHFLCKASGKDSSIGDYSALITGLLLGLTLPPAFPLWMGAVGGFISIALGKFMFGGIGFNIFNPALVGRAFLQAAFAGPIATWTPALLDDRFTKLYSSTITAPFCHPIYDVYDAISTATPLGAWKFDNILTPVNELVIGTVMGSSGETCGVLIILGGIYLAFKKMLDWRIPATIFVVSGLLSGIMHYGVSPDYPEPVFMLFSGGMMLGAVFMATDMVSSPMSPKGIYLYGALIGVLIIVIRLWGGLPEGVMYAILLGNAVTPLINRVTQPRIYGYRKETAS